MIVPEWVDACREFFLRFIEQGKLNSEFDVIHKNGERRYIAFDGLVGYGKDGTFEKTHCILQDITDQKQAQQRLKKLFDVAPIGIGLLKNRIFLEVNGAMCRMTGRSREGPKKKFVANIPAQRNLPSA